MASRKSRRMQALIGGILIALTLWLAWRLTGPRLDALARERLINNIEQITGGKAAVGSVHASFAKLEVVANNITVDSATPAAAPLMKADRIYLRLKLLSIFTGELGVRDFVAEKPVIRLAASAAAAQSKSSRQPQVEQLFDLQAEHLQIDDGELLISDQIIPLNVMASGVRASLRRPANGTAFDGTLEIGKLDAAVRNFRPIGASLKAEFKLGRNALDVRSLNLQSEQSAIEANGKIEDFGHPRAALTYLATIDVPQAGRIARQAFMRSGQIHISGTASGSAEKFSSRGTLQWSDVGVGWPSIQFSKLSGSAQFSADDREINFNNISGKWINSSYKGSAQLQNWSSEFKSNKSVSARVQLAFQNLPAAEVVTSLRRLPAWISSLHPSALADGTIAATWNSPHKLNAQLNASLRTLFVPGTLPVAGRIRGSYASSGLVKLDEVNLRTRASTLEAAGVLGDRNSEVHLSLHSSDVGEYLPLVAALNLKAVPQRASGEALIDALVTGRTNEPEFSGHARISNFSGTFKSAGNTHTEKIEQLSADFGFAPQQLSIRNGAARQGSARAEFSGDGALVDYAIAPDSRIQAKASLRGASLNELAAFAAKDSPVDGTLNLDALVSGTRKNPSAEGRLQLTNGIAYGMRFRSLTGSLALRDHQLSARDLQLAFSGARAQGSGSYDFVKRTFEFHSEGHNFDLAHLRPLQRPRVTVAGMGDFKASGSGTLGVPRINANISLRQLAFNGEEAGDLALAITTVGTEMRVTGRSDFARANINLDGTAQLVDSWPANAELTFTHLDIDPLLSEYLRGRITEHSSADGHITLNGPLRRTDLLTVNGEVTQASVNVENVRVQTAEPVRFSVSNRKLDLHSFHIVGEGTDFSARGAAALVPNGTVNFRGDGRVNLQLLESFDPTVISSGLATVGVDVAGTVSHPAFTGNLQIQDGALSLQDLPTGLSGINGRMVFNENRLELESVTARAGGGVLDMRGFMSYESGLNFAVSLTGRDIRLRYPPGVSSVADEDLKFQGTLQSSVLSGEVRVNKFSINQQFDFASYLARFSGPMPAPNVNSPLNNVHLDVHISTARELDVEVSLAKLSGDADLRVRGTLASPAILGRVDINQGQLTFNGTTYQLDRGDILFLNPVRIQPILDLEASSRIRDYDVTLTFHGPLDKLSITYRSDPPLATSDILALIALGRTTQDELQPAPNQPSLATSGGSELLAAAINATVSSRVQRLFGISRIKIDPIGNPENVTATTQADRGPTLTVEQQVSNRVTLTYITNLAQSSQQVIELVVQINRNTSADAIRDQNGVLGFDVKIRQRKR